MLPWYHSGNAWFFGSNERSSKILSFEPIISLAMFCNLLNYFAVSADWWPCLPLRKVFFGQFETAIWINFIGSSPIIISIEDKMLDGNVNCLALISVGRIFRLLFVGNKLTSYSFHLRWSIPDGRRIGAQGFHLDRLWSFSKTFSATNDNLEAYHSSTTAQPINLLLLLLLLLSSSFVSLVASTDRSWYLVTNRLK